MPPADNWKTIKGENPPPVLVGANVNVKRTGISLQYDTPAVGILQSRELESKFELESVQFSK
jgi:hypothetical protein